MAYATSNSLFMYPCKRLRSDRWVCIRHGEVVGGGACCPFNGAGVGTEPGVTSALPWVWPNPALIGSEALSNASSFTKRLDDEDRTGLGEGA